MFIDRDNKIALITDIEVPLTHNCPNTKAEKITKYEHLVLGIKNIWNLNNVYAYPLIILAEVEETKIFLKYVENIDSTKNILRVGQKAVLLPTCHTVPNFLGHALDLRW